MNTKKMYPFIVLMFLGISILTSCKKEPIGSVSGMITIYDPSSPAVIKPKEGVKLFLVNTDFKLDSVDYANNTGAIADSAVTGADGKYLIAGIPNGNWAVVPIPDSIMYRFEPENAEDSVKFTINDVSFSASVDFKTDVPVANDAGFHIHIDIINRPYGGSVAIYRPVFLFNIIPTIRRQRIDNQITLNAEDMTMNLHFGIFGSLYAVSNNFVIKSRTRNDMPLHTYWITYDYFNTPAYSHWQIDWTAQTITQIE